MKFNRILFGLLIIVFAVFTWSGFGREIIEVRDMLAIGMIAWYFGVATICEIIEDHKNGS